MTPKVGGTSTPPVPYIDTMRNDLKNACPPAPPPSPVSPGEIGKNVSERLQFSDKLRQYQVLQAENPLPPNGLFADKAHSDLYWEALVLAAKGKKEEALALVKDLQTGNPPNITPKWKEGHPGEIDSFFDKLFIDTVSTKPQKLSELGLFESIGIHQHNAYLNDVSKEAIQQKAVKASSDLESLKKYTPDGLTPEQKLSHDILLWKLQHEVKGAPFLFHAYPINQSDGVLRDLSETFTQFCKLDTQEDVKLYISRLERIPFQFRQLIALQKHQQKLGIPPPRFYIEKVFNNLKTFIEGPPTKNLYYTHLANKLNEMKDLDKEKILGKTEKVIKETVKPAYVSLIQSLSTLLETATKNDGVWALPNGKAYYQYTLKHHTTTDYTPKEIFHMGMGEVTKISVEMRHILRDIGIEDDDKSLGELMKQFSEVHNNCYSNDDKGRTECLQDFHKILDRSRNELSPYFDLKPQSPVEIEKVPKHNEEGMPGGYYLKPSIDGSRPGAFHVNLRNMQELPKNLMEMLLVREAEPGHHYQLSLQMEMDIPVVRKLSIPNAYVEGWALYTEKLAYEKEFFTTPQSKLGHLQDELLRAIRLIVDTGIHWKKWTRDEAIEFMEANTGYNRDTVVTEVERYFAWPGQACAYKIGQLKILELRKRAMDKLGDKFDLAKFHNAVLSTGAVPLDILEHVINQYIQKE